MHVVNAVDRYPASWCVLHRANAKDSDKVLQPLGRLKTSVRQQTMVANRNALSEKVNADNKGDQLLQGSSWTPQNLNAEEKAMLEKLKESSNFKPHPEKSERNVVGKSEDMFS